MQNGLELLLKGLSKAMSESVFAWTRSSYCADNACLEVAEWNGEILVRDSKNVGQQFLRFSRVEWALFTDAIATGELHFD
jgi:hypothetical protein